MRRIVSENERNDFQLTQGGFYQLEFLDPNVGKLLDGWYILGRYQTPFSGSSRRFFKVGGKKSGLVINPSVVIYRKRYPSTTDDCVALVSKYISADEIGDYIDVDEDKIIANENSKITDRMKELDAKITSLEANLARLNKSKLDLDSKIESTSKNVELYKSKLNTIKKDKPPVIDNVLQSEVLLGDANFFYVEAVFPNNPKAYTWEVDEDDMIALMSTCSKVVVNTTDGPKIVKVIRLYSSTDKLNHKKIIGLV